MPDPSRTFSTHLRAERTRLAISQETCARLLGVSLSTVCAWERGAEPKGLTRAGVCARLTQFNAGDAALLPNHLRDRSKEVAP